MSFLKLSTIDASGNYRTVFCDRCSIQRVDFWAKTIPNSDAKPMATIWVYGAGVFDIENPPQIVALRTMCEHDTEQFGQPNHRAFDGGRAVEERLLNPRDQESDD